MSFYRKSIGNQGEKLALQYLKNNHFKILNKNFRNRFGEIDIIAQKDKIIYFIEVKTRSNLSKGNPYEAVNQRKINQIKKIAQYFILKKNFLNYKLKIAVISIVLDNKDLKYFEFDY